MAADRYDIIVIGSGPGGASLAQRLAPTGKRLLILERGDYLERSERNWSPQAVFVMRTHRSGLCAGASTHDPPTEWAGLPGSPRWP